MCFPVSFSKPTVLLPSLLHLWLYQLVSENEYTRLLRPLSAQVFAVGRKINAETNQ